MYRKPHFEGKVSAAAGGRKGDDLQISSDSEWVLFGSKYPNEGTRTRTRVSASADVGAEADVYVATTLRQSSDHEESILSSRSVGSGSVNARELDGGYVISDFDEHLSTESDWRYKYDGEDGSYDYDYDGDDAHDEDNDSLLDDVRTQMDEIVQDSEEAHRRRKRHQLISRVNEWQDTVALPRAASAAVARVRGRRGALPMGSPEHLWAARETVAPVPAAVVRQAARGLTRALCRTEGPVPAEGVFLSNPDLEHFLPASWKKVILNSLIVGHHMRHDHCNFWFSEGRSTSISTGISTG